MSSYMTNGCSHDNIFSDSINNKQHSEIIGVYYRIRIFHYYQMLEVVLKHKSTTPKTLYKTKKYPYWKTINVKITKQQSKTNILPNMVIIPRMKMDSKSET